MLRFLPTLSFCGDMIGTPKCIVCMRDICLILFDYKIKDSSAVHIDTE